MSFCHPNMNVISVLPLYSFLGAPKETPVVTPLMEFVRQKRAAKTGTQVFYLGKGSKFMSSWCPFPCLYDLKELCAFNFSFTYFVIFSSIELALPCMINFIKT